MGFRFVGILAFGNPLLRVTARVLPNLLRACTVYCMTTTEPMRTKRTARKQHTCAVPQGCDGTIRPGDSYFDEVSPPWLEYCDDYDPEYGASWVRLEKWEHSRTHVSCSNEWMRKFNAEVGRY